MKKYLISFATEDFYNSQKLLGISGKKYGFELIDYNMEQIKKTDFYKKNIKILGCKRGAGYWAWKPYIILKELKKLQPNDILFYSDSGAMLIADPKLLLDICYQNKRVLFANGGYKQSEWTKRDCFVFTNGDNDIFHNAEHALATFSLWMNTKNNILFLTEWLNYCLNYNIISDEENICGLTNLKGFIDHRHDQSILTQLVTKYNIELYRCPNQYGEFRKDPTISINPKLNNIQYKEDKRISIKTIFTNSNYETLIYGFGKINDKQFIELKESFI